MQAAKVSWESVIGKTLISTNRSQVWWVNGLHEDVCGSKVYSFIRTTYLTIKQLNQPQRQEVDWLIHFNNLHTKDLNVL